MVSTSHLFQHRWPAVIALLGALLSGGCASWSPGSVPLGTPIETLRARFFPPTGEYPLPDGGTRLEFAQGSFGKLTYMLDFDSHGTLIASDQVLDEAHFAKIAPGMSASEVRMRLGRPADVLWIGWQKLDVWNYRYFEGDCIWFQVSLNQAGRVTETGYGPDPVCDGPNIRE
ncbi:MAG TPA: hypothetical protein VFG60_06005 [Burkholderiaceae bacterium]|nr:hypothetical protein [Burkholderiaceae bacterium]